MKTLSIRQPWAWLIVNGFKPVENRTWYTKHRGPTLVHAAKGMKRGEYEAANEFVWAINPRIVLPAFDELKRGGIIGSVEIIDCVSQSAGCPAYMDTPWFTGPFGFVLARPEKLPFIPLKGRLGFFEVDPSLLKSHG